TDRLVPGADEGIGALAQQLLSLLAAANDVDRAEASVLAEADHHAAQGAAGGSLQQPGAARHFQDVLRHGERRGGIDEKSRHLLVGEISRDGDRLVSGNDHLLAPGAAESAEDRDAAAPPPPAEQSAA